MTDMLFTAGSSNVGGLYMIRFCPVVGVSGMPMPALAGPSAPVDFLAGYRWFQLYGTQGSKTLDEQHEDSDNGPMYSVKVETWLPADSIAIRQQLAILVRHPLVLEVEDTQGLIKRVGTQEQFFRLTYKFQSGGEMADKRGYQISFSGQLSEPAPNVTYQ